MGKKVAIVQNAENPEPAELIADAVIKVAEGFAALNSSRLNQRAIVLLLADVTKVPKGDIVRVLDAAAHLKDYYIKKPTPGGK